MKPENPIVKYVSRIIYFFIFLVITALFLFAATFVIAFLGRTFSLAGTEKILRKVIGILTLVFLFCSFWLAKEASNAFSEGSCYFFEAMIVAFKNGISYLQFIPVIGPFFSRDTTPKNRQGNTGEVDSRSPIEPK